MLTVGVLRLEPNDCQARACRFSLYPRLRSCLSGEARKASPMTLPQFWTMISGKQIVGDERPRGGTNWHRGGSSGSGFQTLTLGAPTQTIVREEWGTVLMTGESGSTPDAVTGKEFTEKDVR